MYLTLKSPPRAEKKGENTNFVGFDNMDFKIQALLNDNLVIAKKQHQECSTPVTWTLANDPSFESSLPGEHFYDT